MSRDKNLFRVKTMNQSLDDAKRMPVPRQLFHSFIYEDEITIIMADTNVGKSILAVQIANRIAECVPKGESVLYADLEMSEKQLECRYSDNFTDHFTFHENFKRLDIDPSATLPKGVSYDDYFISSLREAIDVHDAAVVIIDNMSKLISSDTDSAQKAKPLMDRLCALKRELRLTLIILDHTRKTDSNRAISLNDLQGSKMKANFADSVFAIGRSAKEEKMRYLKQLKVRSSEVEYGANNVRVYELTKEKNHVEFKFIGFSTEQEHLKVISNEERQARIEQAKELKNKNYSNREIAKEFGVSEGAVRKWLKT